MERTREDWQASPVTGPDGDSRHPASQLDRNALGVVGSALAVLALAACSGSPAGSPGTLPGMTGQAGQTQSGPGAAAPGADPTPAGAADPSAARISEDAATAAMKQKVADVLSRLAAGTPKPATAQVRDALTGAGVAPAVLEVSASRTPTGLEADAVDAAVLQGADCVVGQVRDGRVTVTVLPVLASGKCFVGAGT